MSAYDLFCCERKLYTDRVPSLCQLRKWDRMVSPGLSSLLSQLDFAEITDNDSSFGYTLAVSPQQITDHPLLLASGILGTVDEVQSSRCSGQTHLAHCNPASRAMKTACTPDSIAVHLGSRPS